MTMDTTEITDPRALIAALSPTGGYWRSMSEKFEALDETVHAIVMAPLFQHTYASVHGSSVDDMILDVRSATSLLASNIFHPDELEVFVAKEVVPQMNQGLALAARDLRRRAPTFPTQTFVELARNVALTYVLRLIGEDLKDPRPVLKEMLAQMKLTDRQRMALLQAAVLNCHRRSSKIVLH